MLSRCAVARTKVRAYVGGIWSPALFLIAAAALGFVGTAPAVAIAQVVTPAIEQPPAGGPQEGPAMERLTFDQAVERAVARNPTIAQAAAGILRAEAILQQVRAVTRASADLSATTSVIHPVVSFDGNSINPRTQLVVSPGLTVPFLAPFAWAQRNQAADQILVARQSVEETRRQIAVATAQSYLQILAFRRVQELNERAAETARAHFDFAHQRFEGGVGSRLNELRAQQELSGDEARVEDARLSVRRAQEALGVLVAADGPVDAEGEPAFETLEAAAQAADAWLLNRREIQLIAARQLAAERVVNDSWRENLPSLTGLFGPQILTPSGLFVPAVSWSARVVFQVPLFDSGLRKGRARERQSQLDQIRAERASLEREIRSEFRAANAAVRSTERALVSARAAADQALEVVRITDAAFRAGATTNIEVIDAQRRARDAETSAVIAEDAVRRARLELLVAVGDFPR